LEAPLTRTHERAPASGENVPWHDINPAAATKDPFPGSCFLRRRRQAVAERLWVEADDGGAQV